jgi:hypothetical protein
MQKWPLNLLHHFLEDSFIIKFSIVKPLCITQYFTFIDKSILYITVQNQVLKWISCSPTNNYNLHLSYAAYELDCVSEPSRHFIETECTATKLLETNHTAVETLVNSANSTFIWMLSTIVTMENFPGYCECIQYRTLYKAKTPVLVLSI